MQIRFEQSNTLKQKPAPETLSFGTVFSDYMFEMDYEEGKGWYDPRIVPYADFQISPAAMVFHYGQAAFEGLKAYIGPNGEILTFRSRDNFERLNRSCERLCMPEIDVDFALDAMEQLIRIEKEWIPTTPNTSLYIRPFIFATQPHVGVKPSSSYKFFIILCPVGAYYKEGLKPIKIYVIEKYVRAAPGGLGKTKAAANYAASLYGSEIAKKDGYSQVLWLDANEHKYVEEVGAMNIFFKIGGVVVTPTLECGSILPGITRRSVIELCEKMGVPVEERRISIDEICAAADNGTLEEVFGSGTAAVISPVGLLHYKDRVIEVNKNGTSTFGMQLYDELTGIQYGLREDPFHWVKKIGD